MTEVKLTVRDMLLHCYVASKESPQDVRQSKELKISMHVETSKKPTPVWIAT